MHKPTAGMDAAPPLVTFRWQKVQSSPMSWTWVVWGNAIGCSGPSLKPKTSSGRPSQAEITKAAKVTASVHPARPPIPKNPRTNNFFLVGLGIKSPGIKVDSRYWTNLISCVWLSVILSLCLGALNPIVGPYIPDHVGQIDNSNENVHDSGER